MDVSSLEANIATLQQRIDQLQANLSQQQKLATMGMVTSVIAHEFNNILTPMMNYARCALAAKGDDALRDKALAKSLQGAERLAAISQSLLGFARGDQSTSADVSRAVTDTLACLSRDLSKDGITLKLDIPLGLCAAMNGGQLQQVLMNLVVNARAAMLPMRGTKRLTIRAALVKKNRIVQIEVSDSGPGIDAAVLPHIFDPFFSTKVHEGSSGDDAMPKGGTGLGLTICQDIIQSAGGTIRVESQVGKGAMFIIELPAFSK